MTKPEDPCSICNKPIGVDSNGWGGGRNSDPVKSGTCCEDCDISIVTPARLLQFFLKNKMVKSEGKV